MALPENALFALALSTLAGLSTCIGGAIAIFFKRPKMIYLAFSLGFSGGVMIYIAFMELLPHGITHVGELKAIVAFFVGIVFIGIIDMLIPKAQNPHQFKTPCSVPDCKMNADIMATGECEHAHKQGTQQPMNGALMRTGVLVAIAIGIHNFPEGLASFGTALDNVQLGSIIALAIAIHNIPEGISVAVPIYCATRSRKKAFYYSLLAGIAEPIGAVIGLLVLMPIISPAVIGALLAFVAGIMVYISVDELLPMSQRCGHNHASVIGLVLGMAVMALSLMVL